MNILQVYDSILETGGGSQIAMLNWSSNLLKRKENVKILTNIMSYKPFKWGKERFIFSQGINLNKYFPNFSVGIISPKVKKEIEGYKPDIIHIHEPSLLSYQVLKIAKKKSIPVLTTFHTDFKRMKVNKFPANLFFGNGKLANKIVHHIQYYLLKNSDYISAPSKIYQQILSHDLKKDVFLIPYPISSAFYSEYPQDKKTDKKIKKLITISRLTGEKNINVLISALRNLDDSFHLTIVGNGIDKITLKNQAKKLGIKNRIDFLDWVPNDEIPNLLENHDAFLSASNYETFGITYIEALARGIPLIVFNYPVSREVVPKNMGIFVSSLSSNVWAATITKVFHSGKIHNLKYNIYNNYQTILKYEETKSCLNLLRVYKKITND